MITDLRMGALDKAIKEVQELREHDEKMKQIEEAIDHERLDKIANIACIEPFQLLNSLLLIMEHKKLIAKLILSDGIPHSKEAIKAIEYLDDIIKKVLYL